MLGAEPGGRAWPVIVRLGRADAKASITGSAPLNPLVPACAPLAPAMFPPADPLADPLVPSDKEVSFTSAGPGIDWNDVVVQTEFAKRKADAYVNDTTSWYVMGGYRFGKFLPYAIHGSLEPTARRPTPCLPPARPATLPPAPRPCAHCRRRDPPDRPPARQGQQSTDPIGVRWDFHRSAALKVQIDRVKPKNGQGLLL